jgi:ubiquinone/menaquinone biosynthesis C-methylase UbiE
MSAVRKGHKGVAMEGFIAEWYARNTAKDVRRFRATADAVAARAPAGGRVLEVAPGPGYLAIELARRGFDVSGLDISRSFVGIARQSAEAARVAVRFEHGDAAHMPFQDRTFDFIVCMAAFKNFTDPLGALDEIHRVLRPGGGASIQDLSRNATPEAIREEVRAMNLSPWNAALTRLTFRWLLLPRAWTREVLLDLARRSRFGGGEVIELGIGFDLRLVRPRC